MIEVVIISTLSRDALFTQSLNSLFANRAVREHLSSLTVVIDGDLPQGDPLPTMAVVAERLIINQKPIGASACRNVGASSIPKYKRGKYLMFLDDDVYLTKGWDEQLIQRMENKRFMDDPFVLSGHSHPFNHPNAVSDGVAWTSVLSTVHFFMEWEAWDSVGYFTEPGGPGGSEDVDWCTRATQKGYRLGVTVPHCIIHTGYNNSQGKPLVGVDLVREQNREIEAFYGLEGKVIYQ